MKKTIKDFNLNGKKVIIRCDFNVPIKNNKIVDNNRIVESLKTINYAIDNNAKVILMSHLGKVKTLEDKQNNSLEIVSRELKRLLNRDVVFVNETRGKKLEDAISKMDNKDVLLIENTRFEDYPDKLESGNNEELGKYWASLGDIFINDAFGTAHRSHASNVGIATYLPSGIGFLIEKEIENLSVLSNPERPYMVILGGSKISDKIEMVSFLVEKADKIIIGGGMAYTFLKSMNCNIGKSICDDESLEFASSLLKKYKDKIILTVDSKVTKEFVDSDNNRICERGTFEEDDMGLDIGPKTIDLFKDELKDAKTIFWNGTLGFSEYKNYAEGTKSILEFVSKLDCNVILGGGDTVAASKVFGYFDKVTFASTGGGATLEYITKQKLPGIEIINDIEG